MKRVLFVIDSFLIGGAEKSLTTLLNSYDFSQFKVEIEIGQRGGVFEKLIPDGIELKEVDVKINLNQRIKYKILRIFNFKKKYHLSQLLWKCIGSNVKRKDEHFDVAIAWGQGFPTYYVAEKINATKKYAWVNNDYDMAGYDAKTDIRNYAKFNKLVAVSDFVKQSLKKHFPGFSIVTIRDIVDNDEVHRKSRLPIEFEFKSTEVNIVSVGRLEKQKSFELAVGAAKYLSLSNYNFHWYIVGEGSQRYFLEKMIKDNDLCDKISLLGHKENPYPFMRACDIYCQTSSYEGLGLTIIEAKILKKPIVTTNFPTAFSTVDHGRTGLIQEMDSKDIADGLERIMLDRELREAIIENSGGSEEEEKIKILKEINLLLNN